MISRPHRLLTSSLFLHQKSSLLATSTLSSSSTARMFAISQPQRAPGAKPRTFDETRNLPKLPIPSLQSSLDRYVTSLRPFLLESGELDQGLEQRRELARSFAEDGLGTKLQERLKDLDEVSPHNWLDDSLWLKKAYHEWRVPLLINSNWWLLFRNDPTVPASIASVEEQGDGGVFAAGKGLSRGNGDSTGKAEFTEWQVRRAAWLTARFLNFKARIESGDILPDSSKAGPLDMYQYTRLFNLSRLPLPGCDGSSLLPPFEKGRHLSVLIRDFIYEVEVLDVDLNVLPPDVIEQRLWGAVEDAISRTDEPLRIGIMTSDGRDEWTVNREHLLSLSPSDKNRKVFESINHSLFALSLDSHTLPPAQAPSVGANLLKGSVDAHVQNCSSGGLTPRNRWMDKALSIFVETNARAGMMGEHSPCDALLPSLVIDYAIAEPISLEAFPPHPSPASSTGWSRLDWDVPSAARADVEARIDAAEERGIAVIRDSEPSQLHFEEFGTDWIKAHGKVAPDAFIQQVLQIAYHADQGQFSATYETASTRMFAHGRTEVIRSFSEDARALVLALEDPSSSSATRYQLLVQACKTHSSLTRDSSSGKGSDRHLFGLKLMLQPGETHPLFEDELFARSAEWKLSTSSLGSGERFRGTGFGTVWPDGYGINYTAAKTRIQFGIESKKSAANTSTHRFKQHVQDALVTLKRVCEEGAGEQKAKL